MAPSAEGKIGTIQCNSERRRVCCSCFNKNVLRALHGKLTFQPLDIWFPALVPLVFHCSLVKWDIRVCSSVELASTASLNKNNPYNNFQMFALPYLSAKQKVFHKSSWLRGQCGKYFLQHTLFTFSPCCLPMSLAKAGYNSQESRLHPVFSNFLANQGIWVFFSLDRTIQYKNGEQKFWR
jgi:hypothetical protein